MYLLTAVADLVRIKQPQSDFGAKYLPTLHQLWSNMVEKKSYVTGGIGAMKKWEGFGIDYFLPQGTDEGGCYAETCAAIGVMMLAERLLQVCTEDRQDVFLSNSNEHSIGGTFWPLCRYHGALLIQCSFDWYESRWESIHICESVGFFRSGSFTATRVVRMCLLSTQRYSNLRLPRRLYLEPYS